MVKNIDNSRETGLFIKGQVIGRTKKDFDEGKVRYTYHIKTDEKIYFITCWSDHNFLELDEEYLIPVRIKMGKDRYYVDLDIKNNDEKFF